MEIQYNILSSVIKFLNLPLVTISREEVLFSLENSQLLPVYKLGLNLVFFNQFSIQIVSEPTDIIKINASFSTALNKNKSWFSGTERNTMRNSQCLTNIGTYQTNNCQYRGSNPRLLALLLVTVTTASYALLLNALQSWMHQPNSHSID